MSSRNLSGLLGDIKTGMKGDSISVKWLLEEFHERGFGFFLFFFALPAALPLPGLGINLFIAIPLIILTAQQAFGMHSVWLPEAVKRQKISRARLEHFIDTANPWLEKLEFLIHPRLEFVTRGIASNITGLLGLVMALSVLVPVPFTNTVPSLGIALMAVGLLMRDGVAVIAGACIGSGWVVILVALGNAGMKLILDTIGL